MKCDELKAEPMIINDDYTALYYPKDSVDAAIDELKREHHKERDEYIDWVNRLQKENAEIKEVYKDSVDVKVKIWERCKKAEDEIRKLKRALWLAREERARSSALSYHLIESHPDRDAAATYKRKANKWEKAKDKCLKKAKEYK